MNCCRPHSRPHRLPAPLPEAGPKDTPQELARAVTYTPPAALLPYLARDSDLYRIRKLDAEKVPHTVRAGHVSRKKDRNAIMATWRRGQDRARMAQLAEEHGLPLPAVVVQATAAAAAAAAAAARGGVGRKAAAVAARRREELR